MCFCDKSYVKNGYACFCSKDNKLLQYLDNKFKEFIKDYDVEEYHIPALIDGEVLSKCGYFSSFPQQLTVAAFVNREYYQDVVANNGIKKEYLEVSNKYLTPAACLHVYPMLENSEDKQNRIITTKARVYRYEGENFKDLTRLWDFTVREIVFVGDRQYVKDKQEEMMKKALEFALQISKEAKIVSANDNFYPSQKNNIKKKIQQTNSLKYELIIPIKNENVAVASFNLHDAHFSKAFNFDNKGTIVTGCTGFGIERWIAACKEHNVEI